MRMMTAESNPLINRGMFIFFDDPHNALLTDTVNVAHPGRFEAIGGLTCRCSDAMAHYVKQRNDGG